MLNRIIHSQEAVDLQRVLSEKNLEEEKKLAEKFITEQEVNEYIHLFQRFRAVVRSCDEISVYPLIDNRQRMIFYFKNVKKPVA